MRIIKLIERMLFEKFDLEFSKKYKKAVLKYSNKPANIKTLQKLIQQLENNGSIESSGLHSIRMPMYSEVSKKEEKGWKVAYVSKSDDLRLGYLKHKNGIIEIKFGSAKDIGYTH